MEDSRILFRCLELECKMLLLIIVEGIGVFPISRMAYLNRVAVSIYRIHGEVEGVNGFAIMMRRVHGRYARKGRL